MATRVKNVQNGKKKWRVKNFACPLAEGPLAWHVLGWNRRGQPLQEDAVPHEDGVVRHARIHQGRHGAAEAHQADLVRVPLLGHAHLSTSTSPR